MLQNQYNPLQTLKFIGRSFENICFNMQFYQKILNKFPKEQIMSTFAKCQQTFVNSFEGPVKEQAKAFVSQFSINFIAKTEVDLLQTIEIKKNVEDYSKRYEINIAKTKSIKKYTCDICKKYYSSDSGLYNHKKRSDHFSVKDTMKIQQMPQKPTPSLRQKRIKGRGKLKL